MVVVAVAYASVVEVVDLCDGVANVGGAYGGAVADLVALVAVEVFEGRQSYLVGDYDAAAIVVADGVSQNEGHVDETVAPGADGIDAAEMAFAVNVAVAQYVVDDCFVGASEDASSGHPNPVGPAAAASVVAVDHHAAVD